MRLLSAIVLNVTGCDKTAYGIIQSKTAEWGSIKGGISLVPKLVK